MADLGIGMIAAKCSLLTEEQVPEKSGSRSQPMRT
jgi:hypothetical protein